MDVRVGLWRRRVPKNWCLWTVVLEKTLESPLDCKEIQPVHSEGNHPWDFLGRNDAKAETPVLWPPHAKSWLIGKDSDAGRDWGQEEKRTTEDEMARWHHWLSGREFEWTPELVMDREAWRAACDSWDRKESDTTEQLIWSDLFWFHCISIPHFVYPLIHQSAWLTCDWKYVTYFHFGAIMNKVSVNTHILTFVCTYFIFPLWK